MLTSNFYQIRANFSLVRHVQKFDLDSQNTYISIYPSHAYMYPRNPNIEKELNIVWLMLECSRNPKDGYSKINIYIDGKGKTLPGYTTIGYVVLFDTLWQDSKDMEVMGKLVN